MNEYQKAFMEVIEHKCSLNQFNVPYKTWIETFKDAKFSIKDLYELFCLGYSEGSRIRK